MLRLLNSVTPEPKVGYLCPCHFKDTSELCGSRHCRLLYQLRRRSP